VGYFLLDFMILYFFEKTSNPLHPPLSKRGNSLLPLKGRWGGILDFGIFESAVDDPVVTTSHLREGFKEDYFEGRKSTI
jgi:hypothetical protein